MCHKEVEHRRCFCFRSLNRTADALRGGFVMPLCALSSCRPSPLPSLPTTLYPCTVRAPAVLHLGLHNSLSEADASCGGSCTITLFAPYWFNNRTGEAAAWCLCTAGV